MILTADVLYVSYVGEHTLHGFQLLTLCLRLILPVVYCSLPYLLQFMVKTWLSFQCCWVWMFRVKQFSSFSPSLWCVCVFVGVVVCYHSHLNFHRVIKQDFWTTSQHLGESLKKNQYINGDRITVCCLAWFRIIVLGELDAGKKRETINLSLMLPVH